MGRDGKAGIGQMTFDRRVADAIELIEFLRRHLGVDKVIVLAESMGTLTGLPLTKHRPDLVQTQPAHTQPGSSAAASAGPVLAHLEP
jgi:pimeloyl-ACP methyl ester carboxylesterase